jgi:hypothetical protein
VFFVVCPCLIKNPQSDVKQETNPAEKFMLAVEGFLDNVPVFGKKWMIGEYCCSPEVMTIGWGVLAVLALRVAVEK